MEVNSQTILTGYSAHEKAAYLGALAALATADREANEEELGHLREIAHAAGVTSDEEQNIIEAAKDTTGNNLKKCLDTLKGSDLKYSLITDLIVLAKADDSYTEDEKGNIEKVARYLNVNQNQFSVLDQFVNKAAEEQHTPEEFANPNFLKSTGMQEKFGNAGLNIGSMGKSIFGFLGPLLLGSIAGRALGGRRAGGLGGLGGGLLGSMLGGAASGGRVVPGGMGSLGSLISGLNRSRGNVGGMLGGLFR
jgi:uncharacterized tellurite resistance protein B-like protein